VSGPRRLDPGRPGTGPDLDDVRIVRAARHREHGVQVANDPLGDEEAQGQLRVVPRRAHGDRRGAVAQADLERLLEDDVVRA
jgi:hypothetical protein